MTEPSGPSLQADTAAFAAAQAQGERDAQARQEQAQAFQNAEADGNVTAGQL